MLRDQFLNWQCRIRQIAMRENEGRPTEGMRPRVLDSKGNQLSDGIITLIVRGNSGESTEFFKFQVQKHNDPQDVYKKGLTYLQATHFHRAAEFGDELTALFPGSSDFSRKLIELGICVLEFEQFTQSFKLPCKIRSLPADDALFQATIWHNRLFNRNLSDDVVVLGFKPDWAATGQSQLS